jgi:AraC-like DNA-binding protein
MGISFHVAEEYLRLLVEFARNPNANLVRACPPARGSDYDPLRPVAVGQIAAPLEQLRRVSTEVPLEWLFGEYIGANSADMVTARALGSQNVGEAMAIAHRHQHIQTNVRSFSMRSATGGGLTEVHHAAEDDADMRFVFHSLLAAKVWLLFHFYQGSGKQHQIDRRAPSFGSLLQRFAGELEFLDVDFQGSEVVLSLDGDVLLQKLPDMGERQRRACDQELRRRNAYVSCAAQWTDRVRAYIRSSNFAEVSVNDVCDAFRMPRRTLGRLLRDEDTSFTAILSELRREKALHLVRSTGVPLKRVAAELGFSMAFKSWTGETPKSFRIHGPARSASQIGRDPELRRAG